MFYMQELFCKRLKMIRQASINRRGLLRIAPPLQFTTVILSIIVLYVFIYILCYF